MVLFCDFRSAVSFTKEQVHIIAVQIQQPFFYYMQRHHCYLTYEIEKLIFLIVYHFYAVKQFLSNRVMSITMKLNEN